MPSLPGVGLYYHSQAGNVPPEDHSPACHDGGLRLCAVRPEDALRHRIFQPSHGYRTGRGAVRAAPMALLGLLVLLFQAILLAHGGLTTLGANTFSMAIAGPIVSYGIFKLCRKLNVNRLVAVGLAAGIGDLFTYCVTAGQLALAHPGEAGVMASMGEFLGIFAVTQIPLAIVEGIIAAIVMMMLESFAKPELREIGYLAKEGN